MRDRNFSNLSVELGDNQGAMEAAQVLRECSSRVFTEITEAGRGESEELSRCYPAVLHLYLLLQ